MKFFERFKESIHTLLHIGVSDDQPILVRQRTSFFNALIISLPLVYLVFVLHAYKSYLRPINEWYFDQYSFFIFTSICGLCLLLNHIGRVEISKVLFLLLWPILLHLIPIVYQQTPTDYYFAFPMGLIFHSMMIQIIYSTKISKWTYLFFKTINFYMMIFFLDILQYFDLEDGSELRQLTHDAYYSIDVILYWFLFNLAIYYIMHVIELNLINTHDAYKIVEKQKVELEQAIEQIKASNSKLVQSEKMASLGVFTAGIAHELNNPMNFIGSGTIVLFDILENVKKEIKSEIKEESPALTKHFQDLEKIRYSINVGVEKSTKIVQSLKDYARPNNDTPVLTNTSDCIKNALILIPQSYKQRVKLIENYPDAMPCVCNPTKMTQVFVNLIQNAIDATPDGAEIIIHGRIDKSLLIFEIQDHGHGISPQNLAKIFDPFFTTKGVGKGTGLGLYIVHDMIIEHKGTIDVYSKIDEGTTFKITLPR